MYGSSLLLNVFRCFSGPSEKIWKPKLSCEMRAPTREDALSQFSRGRSPPARSVSTCPTGVSCGILRSGQPERGQSRCHGAQEVYRVVINQMAPLQPGPEKAVRDHSQDRGAHRDCQPPQRQQTADKTNGTHNSGSDYPRQGSDQADGAICPGRDKAPSGDQAGFLAEGPTHFTGNRISRGSRECCGRRKQEEPATVANDRERGTSCSHPQI